MNDSEPKATVQSKRAESTTQSSKPIEIGSEVIVNGQLFRDSYGSGAGKTLSNYKGTVNFINTDGSHLYHIATSFGEWLGWVTAESVKAV